MLDIFGVDNDKFIETTKELTSHLAALETILIEKGIIKEDEFNLYLKATREQINKRIELNKLEQERKLKEENPIFAKLCGIE